MKRRNTTVMSPYELNNNGSKPKMLPYLPDTGISYHEYFKKMVIREWIRHWMLNAYRLSYQTRKRGSSGAYNTTYIPPLSSWWYVPYSLLTHTRYSTRIAEVRTYRWVLMSERGLSLALTRYVRHT